VCDCQTLFVAQGFFSLLTTERYFAQELFKTSHLRKIRLWEQFYQSIDLFTTPCSDAPPEWKHMKWTEYIAERGYVGEKFIRASSADQRACVEYLSSCLSFPLTIAHCWEELGLGRNRDTKKLAIVGAANESEVSAILWSDLSILVGQSVDIEFIGAEVEEIRSWCEFDHLFGLAEEEGTEKEKGRRCKFQLHGGDSNLTTTFTHTRGLVEDVFKKGWLESKDAIIAFQPGAGTNNDYTWEKAFPFIRKAERPVLLTASDEDDSRRDQLWWKAVFKENIVYEQNPWRAVPDSDMSCIRIPANNGQTCVLL